MKAPKMIEISKLLQKIGEPGEKRDEKDVAVRKLFEQSGTSMTNPQGFTVLDDLVNYKEY